MQPHPNMYNYSNPPPLARPQGIPTYSEISNRPPTHQVPNSIEGGYTHTPPTATFPQNQQPSPGGRYPPSSYTQYSSQQPPSNATVMNGVHTPPYPSSLGGGYSSLNQPNVPLPRGYERVSPSGSPPSQYPPTPDRDINSIPGYRHNTGATIAAGYSIPSRERFPMPHTQVPSMPMQQRDRAVNDNYNTHNERAPNITDNTYTLPVNPSFQNSNSKVTQLTQPPVTTPMYSTHNAFVSPPSPHGNYNRSDVPSTENDTLYYTHTHPNLRNNNTLNTGGSTKLCNTTLKGHVPPSSPVEGITDGEPSSRMVGPGGYAPRSRTPTSTPWSGKEKDSFRQMYYHKHEKPEGIGYDSATPSVSNQDVSSMYNMQMVRRMNTNESLQTVPGAPPIGVSRNKTNSSVFQHPFSNPKLAAESIRTSYDSVTNTFNEQYNSDEMQGKREFNAPPHFVRSSCAKLPNSLRVLQKAHVPIALIFQPLAPVPDGFPEVPVISFGSSPMVRCERCRAYINPFVKWESSNRRWHCNFCGTLNECPPKYFRTIESHGLDNTSVERTELVCGSVEMIASSDYLRRPPVPPSYMFLIDVSANSINYGLLDVVCASIKESIKSGKIPGGARTKVGIITFDSTIHFYNISSPSPQMLVVPDLETVFLPLPNDILVYVQDSMEPLINLLDSLPKIWKGNTIADSCLGSALQLATIAINSLGGKLCVFSATLPTIGLMPLASSRPADKNTKSQEEKDAGFYRPLNDLYKDFAANTCHRYIAVHLFVCSASHSMDLATIYPLVRHTSGELHFYPQFNAHQHGKELAGEIFALLTSEIGWEAVMRFRVSTGWIVNKWYGHFTHHDPDLLVIPNCHPTKCYTIMLRLDESVTQKNFVFIQSALLYTNSDGERRIRVHTYCLPVTPNYLDVCNSMDPQVIACVLAQEAIEKSLKGTLADARHHLEDNCSKIMSSQSTPLSNAAKLLPLYILGLLKSPAFRSANAVLPDVRIYHWSRLLSLPLDIRIAYCYPRLYSLHDLEDTVGIADESGKIVLPNPLSLTRDSIKPYGVYLLEDGECLIIWIGRAVSSSWLEAVFGVSSLDLLHPDYAKSYIGCSGMPQGAKVLMIMQEIFQQRRMPYMKVIVIRDQDPLESRFFLSLVEDATSGMRLSYKDFMQALVSRSGVRPPPNH